MKKYIQRIACVGVLAGLSLAMSSCAEKKEVVVIHHHYYHHHHDYDESTAPENYKVVNSYDNQ